MAKLRYLVIHATDTPAGRRVTGADIRHWHTDPVSLGGRGWKQVGYSVLFRLDGSVEHLVDYNEDDTVDPWEVTNGAAGYNSVSRHIVYAGGRGANGKPADTRTAAQRKAMAEYVIDFHRRHPDVMIIGHRDLPKVAKACPCFDVAAWLREIGL
ncbi:MAG: N-acetylmuramoyl-L-alanine amidase [Pseudoflavonifractor sp.]|nr:N-acetylmuramoyl-L-alanine amidase [Pseudoflavonifractor sp.]